MAINDDRFDSGKFKGLDEMGDYRVADGEPDPRGWEVYSGSNKIGEVDDLIVDTSSMKVRYLDVDLDENALASVRNAGDDHCSIPVEGVQLDHQRKQVLLGGSRSPSDFFTNQNYRFHSRSTGFDRAHSGALPPDREREYDLRGRADDETHRTLTRAEEEVDINKERVQTGEVVVGKHVDTEHFEQPITRKREEVDIQRRPVSGRAGDATIGSGQDEVRIPISEERVTVHKEPVVKEELVVNKRVVEEKDKVGTDVRKERFDVDKRGRDRE